jgi:hypothetical protein
MYEVESNFGATKANHFLTRTYNIQLSLAGANLHHVVTVDLTNNTPPGYEGGILYDCYFRLYVPANATNLKTLLPLAQRGIPDDTVPAGYQIFQGWLEINPNRYTERTLSFSYDTPWTGGSGDHAIYWQKQPGTGSDKVTVNWRPAPGLSYTVAGTLATDKEILLAPHSVSLAAGLAGAAQMPRLSL